MRHRQPRATVNGTAPGHLTNHHLIRCYVKRDESDI